MRNRAYLQVKLNSNIIGIEFDAQLNPTTMMIRMGTA
jgi:hypothetical protein